MNKVARRLPIASILVLFLGLSTLNLWAQETPSSEECPFVSGEIGNWSYEGGDSGWFLKPVDVELEYFVDERMRWVEDSILFQIGMGMTFTVNRWDKSSSNMLVEIGVDGEVIFREKINVFNDETIGIVIGEEQAQPIVGRLALTDAFEIGIRS